MEPKSKWDYTQTVIDRDQSDGGLWHWAFQEAGTIEVPEFIRLRSRGEAKIVRGHIFIKKDGLDPMGILGRQMTVAWYGDVDKKV